MAEEVVLNYTGTKLIKFMGFVFEKGWKTVKRTNGEIDFVVDATGKRVTPDDWRAIKGEFEKSPCSCDLNMLPAVGKSTVDDVVASAKRRASPQKLEGARALDKKLGHAQREGYVSAFEGIRPTQENAEKVIQDILSQPTIIDRLLIRR